jgi:hypothetical protein
VSRDAELFVLAERVLVEVVGRVRPEDGGRRDASGTPLRQVVADLARADAALPELLAGVPGPPADAPYPAIVDAACAAAERVTGPSELLLRAAVERCTTAHDIAMALGSRACPLTEEVARGLHEETEPRADHWRALGVFRAPLPLPAGHVSWRDRFLLLAGRDPHPWAD